MPDGGLYDRQRSIGLNLPSSLTIAGLGGIGSWAAIDAAMSGVENLYLFDPDVLEESNRNRLPFCQSSINRPKVEVVAEYIRAIRPEAIIVAIQDKLEGILLEIQMSISSIIMDFTDSPKAQVTICNACRQNRIPYIRGGYDGTHITVTSVVSGWIKGDVEQETYQINPSWVVPAQMTAALAVGKLLKYQNQEVSLDISEIGVPIAQRRRRLTAGCHQDTGSVGTIRRTPPRIRR